MKICSKDATEVVKGLDKLERKYHFKFNYCNL